MLPLRTAVLLHTTAEGEHFDWLVESPHDRGGRLWTARVKLPPKAWPDAGRLVMQEALPHRREYLAYQGPISEGRGEVRRVALGWAESRLWTVTRRVLRVDLVPIHAMILMRRIAPDRWLADVCRGGDTMSPP